MIVAIGWLKNKLFVSLKRSIHDFRIILLFILLMFLIFILFIISSLSFGLDLWNDDKFGGISESETIPLGSSSFQKFKSSYPYSYTPAEFLQTFHLTEAQKMGRYGEGETIAFFEMDNSFNIEAYHEFCNLFSVNTPELKAQNDPIFFKNGVPIDEKQKTPLTPSSLLETTMDIEWAHVIAPKAKLLIISVKDNNASQIQSILEKYHVTVLSSSICLPTISAIRNPIWDLALSLIPIANYQFQKIDMLKWIGSHYPYFVSSGDNGSFIHPATIAPQSVIVGGIEEESYTDDHHQIDKYKVWQKEGNGIASFVATARPYQNLSNSNPSYWRQSPDVTWLSGYPSVVTYTPQGWYLGKGTSLSTPCWAALWALGNAAHKDRWNGVPLPTDANQVLYLIAHNNPQAFHKNTKENKEWVTGWGLGFPEGNQIVKSLSDFNNKDIKHFSTYTVSVIPFWILVALLFLLVILCLFIRIKYKSKTTLLKILKRSFWFLIITFFVSMFFTFFSMQMPVDYRRVFYTFISIAYSSFGVYFFLNTRYLNKRSNTNKNRPHPNNTSTTTI